MTSNSKSRSVIWSKIRTLALLAGIARQAQRLNVGLSVGSAPRDWNNVVNSDRRTAAHEANSAVSVDDFLPLNIRQPVSRNSGLPQPLVGPPENRICTRPRFGIRLLRCLVPKIMPAAQPLSLFGMRLLPSAQAGPHCRSMCLLVGSRLLSSTRLTLRVIATAAKLPVEAGRRPKTTSLFTLGSQNNAAFTV